MSRHISPVPPLSLQKYMAPLAALTLLELVRPSTSDLKNCPEGIEGIEGIAVIVTRRAISPAALPRVGILIRMLSPLFEFAASTFGSSAPRCLTTQRRWLDPFGPTMMVVQSKFHLYSAELCAANANQHPATYKIFRTGSYSDISFEQKLLISFVTVRISRNDSNLLADNGWPTRSLISALSFIFFTVLRSRL